MPSFKGEKKKVRNDTVQELIFHLHVCAFCPFDISHCEMGKAEVWRCWSGHGRTTYCIQRAAVCSVWRGPRTAEGDDEGCCPEGKLVWMIELKPMACSPYVSVLMGDEILGLKVLSPVITFLQCFTEPTPRFQFLVHSQDAETEWCCHSTQSTKTLCNSCTVYLTSRIMPVPNHRYSTGCM